MDEEALAKRTVSAAWLTAGALCAAAWLVQLAFTMNIPVAWQQNGLAAHMAMGKATPIDPYNMKTFVSAIALLVGAGIALPLKQRFGDFDPTGPWSGRLLRYALGMAIFMGLDFGLARVLPKEGHSFYLEFRGFRYVVLALWVLALAPWLFLRLRLAQARQD